MALGALAVLAATTSAPIIDVYTMGAGQDLFERFGHAAICVQRGVQTRCYNYGTTDFGSPPQQLGWRFLRGDAEFWVSVWERERMLAAYVRSDRTVVRQRLALKPAVAERVARRLERDALPENRRYLYHHFDDNCSTRVRDVVDEALDGELRRRTAEPVSETFRGLGRLRLAGETSLLLAGDVLVGRRADRALVRYDRMFLPDYLHDELTPWATERTVVYERRGAPFAREAPRLTLPWLSATALLGAGSLLFRDRPRAFGWWLRSASVVLGLLGLLVWSLAAVSRVPELVQNEMLAVWWPSDVLFGFGSERLRRGYAKVRVLELLGVALLSAAGVLIQPLVWPLLLVLPLAFVVLTAASPASPPPPARS